MKFKNTFLWLAVVATLVSGAGLAICVYQITHFDGEAIDYHREGGEDARRDLRSGTMRIKDAPADTLTDRIFKDSLDSSNGIGRDRLVFDTAPDHVSEYVRGYNEVMEPAIERYIGSANISQARTRARERFEREYQAEEYAVWSVLLDELGGDDRHSFFVIAAETWDRISKDDFGLPHKFELQEVIKDYSSPRMEPMLSVSGLKEATQDYKARNETPERLNTGFKMRAKCKLLDGPALESLFVGPRLGWENYYKKFPASFGYIRLSRVGFNRDMTEALAYLELHCGSLCADGTFRILAKENGTWKIQVRVPFYAS